MDARSALVSRVKETNAGRVHNQESDAYHDELYAFFLNCYHLKDWLQHDRSVASVVRDIEDYINRSESLSVCADLANASKHLKLTRARVDTDTAVARRHFSLGVGTKETTLAIRYEVDAAGKTYDGFELSTECVTDWEKYLKEKGLL